MLWCLLSGRHKWMPWFRSGTGEWMRGCTRCPEIEVAAFHPESGSQKHAAWCWLPADHQGLCEGDQ